MSQQRQAQPSVAYCRVDVHDADDDDVHGLRAHGRVESSGAKVLVVKSNRAITNKLLVTNKATTINTCTSTAAACDEPLQCSSTPQSESGAEAVGVTQGGGLAESDTPMLLWKMKENAVVRHYPHCWCWHSEHWPEGPVTMHPHCKYYDSRYEMA
eukprot:scaffold49058_cov43-Prasinocladus_malaysianus.AAC.1